MFLDQQTIRNYYELDGEFLDFVVDTAAVVSPVFPTWETINEYNVRIKEWDDCLHCLINY